MALEMTGDARTGMKGTAGAPPGRAAVLGAILAGGQSRRMEGREKSLIELAGKPLIARAIERLAPQAVESIICANGNPERFSAFGQPVIADTVEGFAGPLAGILAALRHAGKSPGITHVLSVATDTPFYPADLLERFSACIKAEGAPADAICIAASAGKRHPVFGLWPVMLADDLERFLVEEKGRKVTLFAERHPCFETGFAFAGTLDPFFNINTTDDLAEAERIVRTEPAP